MSDNHSFSQRMGFTPTTKLPQIESMDIDLRNGLWNLYRSIIEDFEESQRAYVCSKFFKWLRLNYYKERIDEVNLKEDEGRIKRCFIYDKWHNVFDFLEFFAKSVYEFFFIDPTHFRNSCNAVLEREFSAYRFVGDKIAPISNQTEIASIEDALKGTNQFTALQGANTHLSKALGFLSDRINPDYKNSIKESISAVESIAKVINGSKKGTLSDALKKIKDTIGIHPVLMNGFNTLYGYTSDEGGIRHAAIDDASDVDSEEAQFFLVSCSAFINYLIRKAQKAGISLEK